MGLAGQDTMRKSLSVQDGPNKYDIILGSHLGDGELFGCLRQEQEAKLFKVRSHDSSWQNPNQQMACVCSHILEGMGYAMRAKERSPFRDTCSAICHFD